MRLIIVVGSIFCLITTLAMAYTIIGFGGIN